MLRPLNVFQRDKDGSPKLDDDGRRIMVKGAAQGQPLADKDLTDGERGFLGRMHEEHTVPHQLRQMQRRRDRQQLEKLNELSQRR